MSVTLFNDMKRVRVFHDPQSSSASGAYMPGDIEGRVAAHLMVSILTTCTWDCEGLCEDSNRMGFTTKSGMRVKPKELRTLSRAFNKTLGPIALVDIAFGNDYQAQIFVETMITIISNIDHYDEFFSSGERALAMSFCHAAVFNQCHRRMLQEGFRLWCHGIVSQVIYFKIRSAIDVLVRRGIIQATNSNANKALKHRIAFVFNHCRHFAEDKKLDAVSSIVESCITPSST